MLLNYSPIMVGKKTATICGISITSLLAVFAAWEYILTDNRLGKPTDIRDSTKVTAPKDIVTLINGLSVEGSLRYSEHYPHNRNLRSREKGLVERSYVDGVIVDIRQPNKDDPMIDYLVRQYGPNGVVMLFRPEQGNANYFFYVTVGKGAYPIQSFYNLQAGDMVSVPTLREYNYPPHLFKILGVKPLMPFPDDADRKYALIDELRAHEIKKK